MEMIKCPKCGEQFSIDESGYAEIVKQVRDKEFRKEIEAREKAMTSEKEAAVALAKANAETEKETELAALREKIAVLEAGAAADLQKAAAEHTEKLADKDGEIAALKQEIALLKANAESAVKDAIGEKIAEINALKADFDLLKVKNENALREAVSEKEREVTALKSELELGKSRAALEKKSLQDAHAIELKMKDELIAQYRDFKAKQSTKMIGESLEQYCSDEFNKIRMTAFPNAYFEKDNDVSQSGSKGDFIYRESEDGVEFLSIMFDMKNEADTTATKHKNEDFLKELDKDRREKGCEYAVLVSMLESDSELYNTGIVQDYRYDKTFIVRPQFFIPLITILRDAARNSVAAKKELALIREQNLDITNFESDMNAFKEDFSRNVELAGKRFQTAIEEIDKSIAHLQKIKDSLTASEKQLNIANRKAEELTIKKLTSGNPTMRAKFAALEAKAPVAE